MKSNLSIKQKFTKISEIPEDVVMGIPLLTALGNTEICIENYGGIIEYTDCLIRIRTKTGKIIISGKNLNVDYYTNDEMKIQGRISSIEYCY